MSIRQITPNSQIGQHLAQKIADIEREAIRNLSYTGEQCFIAAKENGAYTDRTGNLRSSVGYLVIKNGVVVNGGGFEDKGEQGKTEGEAFANKLVSKFPRGLVLVFVAGMNYAAYVSARGYDVLDSAELTAKRLVPIMMTKLKSKAAR